MSDWLNALNFVGEEKLRDYAFALASILCLGSVLVVFISLDLAEYDPAHPHAMHELVVNVTAPDHLAPGRYFAWIGFLTGVFLVYRTVVSLTDWLGPERMTSTRKGLDALSRLVYDGSFLYVASGVRDKVFYPSERIPYGVFLALVTLFSAAYAVAFRLLQDKSIAVTRARLSSSPVLWFTVILPSACIVVLTVVYHMMTAWRVSAAFFSVYVSVVAFVFGFHAISIGYVDHLHHWYWALLCAHACVFNTDASIVAQAAFVAIYIHGVAMFGPTSIYADAKEYHNVGV